MWKLNKGWWATFTVLLLPGVIALAIGIVHPGARTSDDQLSMKMFGVIWILAQAAIQGAIFGWMGWQRKRAAYFKENGIRGVATILAAEMTGTTVNDMPQIELRLELTVPGRAAYAVTDKRCWSPLSLAGLQQGMKLPVLVDPRQPERVFFIKE